MNRILLRVLVALLLVPAVSAQAEIVTWNFSGTLGPVIPATSPPIISLAAGDAFSGSITFETASVPGSTGDDGLSEWAIYPDAITALELTVGSFSFTGPVSHVSVFNPGGSTEIKVVNDYSGILNDGLGFITSVSGGPVDGYLPGFFELYTDTSPGTGVTQFLSSPDLPASPPASAFYFALYFEDNAGGYVATVGGSATVSAVPLPAAVWLFGSGLLGLLVLSRRRHAA